MVKYIVALICGILSVSCVFDTGDCPTYIPTTPVVLEGERTISFTIGLNESTTRVECDTTDYAVPFDYHINPGTLRVMLTDTANNAIGSEAIFLLEQFYGLYGCGAKDAVNCAVVVSPVF